MTDELVSAGGATRRQALQRAGLVAGGAAAVWVAPSITSLDRALAATAGSPAPNATVGYTFTTANGTTGGNAQDQPNLYLSNASDPGIYITAFMLSIGDTSKNFDRWIVVPSDISPSSYTVTGPDQRNGYARSDTLLVSFSPSVFDTPKIFRIGVELDRDTGNSTVDYRTVFFNNGPVSNSQLTVSFSDGTVLTQPLSDQTPNNQTNYTFAQSN